jgi:hypothetical protein
MTDYREWHQYILSDHWQPLTAINPRIHPDVVSEYDATFRQIIDSLSYPNLIPSLQADSSTALQAWLHTAWKMLPRMDIEVKPQVIEATLDATTTEG